MRNCRLLVGTSGYSYGEWVDAGFYPPGTKSGKMLPVYARTFPITELNYTWYQMPKQMAVLTPHPGEMAVLTGLTIDEVQKDREGVAKKFSAEWGHVVVLKGAVTIIASPDGRTAFIPIATPALASAGTGDVLSGMITGLIVQGMKAFDAAVAGAWIYARAGVAAAKKQGQTRSVTASDVIDQIPYVLKDITGTN